VAERKDDLKRQGRSLAQWKHALHSSNSVRSGASILREARKSANNHPLGESQFAFKPSNAQSSMGRLTEVIMRFAAMIIAALLTLALAAFAAEKAAGPVIAHGRSSADQLLQGL
jgi:hypothetical protein